MLGLGDYLKLNEFTKLNYNHTRDPRGQEAVWLQASGTQYFVSTFNRGVDTKEILEGGGQNSKYS